MRDHHPVRATLFVAVTLLALVAAVFPAAVPSAHAAASLQLSRAKAASGDTVAVRGYGFTPGGTAVVSVDFAVGGTVQRTTAAAVIDASGAFTTTFTVPGGVSSGAYAVTAKDFHGRAAASNLIIRPLAMLRVGQPAPTVAVVAFTGFFVRGSGFRPGAAVKLTAAFPLYNGNTENVAKTINADKYGNIDELFLDVPLDSRQGNVTLTATGPKNAASARLAVVYRPSVALSSAIARPGSSISVRGSGFVPNAPVRGSIVIARNGATSETLTQNTTADAYGNFSTSLSLPSNVKVGGYSIKATGLTAGFSAAAALTVSVHPTITVQPGTASPGEVLTVAGGGFGSGATLTLTALVPLYGGGTKVVSFAVKTNGDGAFATHLALPSNAAAGPVSVTARGPNGQATSRLQVRRLAAAITVSPASVIPGSNVVVAGIGYPAGDRVSIVVTVTLTNGSKQNLTTSAAANKQGAFTAVLKVPANVSGGAFTVVARSGLSGRAPTARLLVIKLAPSIVAVPTSAVPGTQVTVNGFGFAADQAITLTLGNSTVGTVTTDAAGKFSQGVTVPSDLATGSYALNARGTAGRTASIPLAVNRTVSTHFYFASQYTGRGYHEYLAFLNPSAIAARVTITYEPTTGATRTKVISVNPHSRFTEDVNVDLGYHVSAGSAIAADVPIVAERYVFHGSDAAVDPGVRSPATSWYFANGNTGKGYRTYVAIQNPNSTLVQVAVHFLPAHHRAFTITRMVAPTSRTTVKVNSYVPRDAVGVVVTSNGPVVANRTIFIRHGITSKIGVVAPERTWYFAAGPQNVAAHNWIGVINPFNTPVRLTLRAYGPFGIQRGVITARLRAHARVGYLMNHVAHTTDVAVVITSSGPVVAEQTSYANKMHDASTDTFGVPSPGKAWLFAAVNTSTANGSGDTLDLFNPNLTSIPIVVQFMTASGSVSERTFVVGPLYHQYIDVGSVAPNAQLGIVAASNYPFVALNRAKFNFGHGADTSPGIQG